MAAKTPILAPATALEGIAAMTAAAERVAAKLEGRDVVADGLAVERVVPGIKPPYVTDSEVVSDVLSTGSLAPKAPTDDDIYNKVGAFLDPLRPAPIFISKPIGHRVYVGVYPNYVDNLKISASRSSYDGPEGDITQLINVVAELTIAIRGWVFENSPQHTLILSRPDPGTWGDALHPFWLLESREPNMQETVVALANDYGTWKTDVTPTHDELEKFYARKG